MNNLAIRLVPETIRSLAFGSISGAYALVGSALTNQSRLMFLNNTTDVLLTVSFDGVNDHMVIPAFTSEVLDAGANRADPAGALMFPAGQKIYVKGAPTVGSFYVSTFYASN